MPSLILIKVVALPLGGLSISGLFVIGKLGFSQQNIKLRSVIYLALLIVGGMQSSCHSDGGGSSATGYSDSFDLSDDDPDTPTETVNLKGLIP